ncbi:MAG: M43 family zinc metalloprotease [Saprospiraceae bacterium]
MKNKFFFLLFGALMAASPLSAQHTIQCGAPSPEKPLIFRETSEPLPDDSYLYVYQIYVHLLSDDDGSKLAMSPWDLGTNLQRMAGYFQPHNICFELVGMDYINNTEWNSKFELGMIGALHAVNPHSNAIDIYIHNGSIGGWGGMAYDYPGTHFSVAGYAPTLFEHEMGHCLGLMHTFETGAILECPSGSNGSTTGDLIKDTPADFPGSEAFVNNCVYTGDSAIFCSGANWLYKPLTNNIMSYNHSDCITSFTAGQGVRMRNMADTTSFLKTRLAPENRTVTGMTLGGEFGFSAKNTISIGNLGGFGNVNITSSGYGVFTAGSLVKLLPGTYITANADGTNRTRIKINDLCDGNGIIGDDPSNDRSIPSNGVVAEPVFQCSIMPNPFLGSTNVVYTLTEPSRIGIRIFNATGGLVATLVPGQTQEAGEYRYEFDAKDLATGIYFLDVQKDGIHTTKRLVLIPK